MNFTHSFPSLLHFDSLDTWFFPEVYCISFPENSLFKYGGGCTHWLWPSLTKSASLELLMQIYNSFYMTDWKICASTLSNWPVSLLILNRIVATGVDDFLTLVMLPHLIFFHFQKKYWWLQKVKVGRMV